MEETVNVITLEDGIEYAIIDEIKADTIKYVYLSNINDDEDICIRKVIVENNEEILIGLDNDSELELALMLFAKKNKEELEK